MTALVYRIPVLPRPALPRGLAMPGAVPPRSLVHSLALGLVWLAVASGSVVFTEPAPTDVLTLGVIVLLPVIGLVAFRAAHMALAAIWLVICAGGFVAAIDTGAVGTATTHMAVSLYLCLASVVLAGFVTLKPVAHTRLLLNAHLAGALIAASAGIAGYFGLFAGAADLFVKFERASGPFKDPNVFGPYLIPAIVYALHLWLTRPLHRGLLPALAFAVLTIALLLSFSRAAWAGAVVAIALYLYLSFVTTRRDLDRLRITGLVLAGALLLVPLLAAALQHDAIGKLFSERATLTQSYDVGPEGRFGGQEKALDLIAEHPLGLGALEFSRSYHHEEVHNVYLSMFLNAGWIGGCLFLALSVSLLALSLKHALRRGTLQALHIVAFAALSSNVLIGAVIDTDHWRHLYLLIAIAVGLMAARPPARRREARILADRRQLLLRRVVVLAPPRREARIVRRSGEVVELFPDPLRGRPPGGFKRAVRLIGPVRPKRLPRLRGTAVARV